MGSSNLIPTTQRSKDEVRKNASKGGIKSGQVRRVKKNMREIAKELMASPVSDGLPQAKKTLSLMGIDENDMTYQAAVVVRVLQKAMVEGDPQAIRILMELTGELGIDPSTIIDTTAVDVTYPSINLPDNGRDTRPKNILAPQAGPQTMFMASNADIVIYGGAAGGGKTYALLLEALRHKDVQDFGAVIFRHHFNQIKAEGGLWDASKKVYTKVSGAVSRKSAPLRWEFGGKSKLSFAHIESDEDLGSWQGTEICFIGFDELTHFTKHQFLYMLSRNRSTCGVKPYIRATCNPDADSWVAEFIAWWIDQDTGYPIKERSGQIQWMVNLNDAITWHASKEDAMQYAIECGLSGEEAVYATKSVTFIASSIYDNKVLMETNPGYIANLRALPEVDKERLLNGNWKIKAAAGKFFKRSQVEIITVVPKDIVMWCRAWDLAATDEDAAGDPDYTAGVLMGKRKDGTIVVLDVINQRLKAGDVSKLIMNTSMIDRQKYKYQYFIRIPQDPGAAGKTLAAQYIKMLSGYNIKVLPVSGSKEVRATPLAAQWQNGNVQVLLGEWNDMYFSQMESFPGSKHDDMVDASSDAFAELTDDDGFNIDNLL